MIADSEKAKRYRERAKQIRSIAEDVRGDDARKVLLAVASHYEDLAASFTSQAKPKARK